MPVGIKPLCTHFKYRKNVYSDYILCHELENKIRIICEVVVCFNELLKIAPRFRAQFNFKYC